MKKSKLVLGTVQLGMNYGVNNTVGQPSRKEAFAILDAALTAGINTFDTAFSYGEAEDILGEWMTEGAHNDAYVISKMSSRAPEQHSNLPIPESVFIEEAERSLRRLRLKSMEGYLLHKPEHMYRKDVMRGLHEIKRRGLAKNIGVSIYEAADALHALELGMDYIQVPYNAFDQRLDDTDFFERAKEKGITVFARSPLLQGLLVMEPERLPAHLIHARPYLERFIDITKRNNLSQIEAALLFVHIRSRAEHIVFGVETVSQVRDIVTLFADTPSLRRAEWATEMAEAFRNVDSSIINPSLWNKNN